MLITVAICTYRRYDRLEFALASLERQTYQGCDWEVLVVENDVVNMPAMKMIYERYKDKLPLRHIVENSIGLSYARNTALREANGDYVAYLDDDIEADSSWLTALVYDCREFQPDFCGGPNYPLYRTPKPSWYQDQYATVYFYGDHSRWLSRDELLGGMNFIVKRALCVQLGGFKTDLGMVGDTIAYGEDTQILMRAWVVNPQLRVRYLFQASVYHEVRPEKMTLCWKVMSAWAGGRSFTIMFPITRKQAIVGFLRNAQELVKRLGCVRICWQQWVFEEFYPWFWHFSCNWHALFRW